MRSPRRALAAAAVLALAACTALPRAELGAFSVVANEATVATDAVLDIVAPYERLALRNAPAVCRGALTINADAYCYQARAAFADIGDPPLVDAMRRLSDTVDRFSRVLVALANGISIEFVRQDLGELSAAAGAVTAMPGFAAAQPYRAAIEGVVSQFAGVARLGLGEMDRATMRAFVLETFPAMDESLRLMAEGSDVLYANVLTGTQILADEHPGSFEALYRRQPEIRRLLANWTVLLDEQRRQLERFRDALADPGALETRLLNLNEARLESRVDAAIVRRQAEALGSAPVGP